MYIHDATDAIYTRYHCFLQIQTASMAAHPSLFAADAVSDLPDALLGAPLVSTAKSMKKTPFGGTLAPDKRSRSLSVGYRYHSVGFSVGPGTWPW